MKHPHPTWHHRLLYYAFECRVPYENRYWAREEIMSRYAGLRRWLLFAPPTALFAFFAPTLSALSEGDYRYVPWPQEVVTGVAPVVFVAFIANTTGKRQSRPTFRDRVLKDHGFAPDGAPFDGVPPLPRTTGVK